MMKAQSNNLDSDDLRFLERVADILNRRGKGGAVSFLGLAARANREGPAGAIGHGTLLRSWARQGLCVDDLRAYFEKARPELNPSTPEDLVEAGLTDIAAAFRSAAPFAQQTGRNLEGRLFPPLTFGNGWCISLQGDLAGYACTPRKKLPYLEDYDALEAVIYAPDDHLVDPARLGLSGEVLQKFTEACSDGPYIGAKLDWIDIAELCDAVRNINEPTKDMKETTMSPQRDEKSYAFLTPVGPDGKMAQMDVYNTRWTVAVARPREGSLTERDLSEVQEFDDVEDAAKAFFALMGEGLPGVLDSPNLREFHDSPLAFTDALTDAVHNACDAIPDEDQREDDWDNTEFSALRDAMVDACPGYSGAEPENGPDM